MCHPVNNPKPLPSPQKWMFLDFASKFCICVFSCTLNCFVSTPLCRFKNICLVSFKLWTTAATKTCLSQIFLWHRRQMINYLHLSSFHSTIFNRFLIARNLEKNNVVCVVGGSSSRVCVWDLYLGGFATLIVNPDFRRWNYGVFNLRGWGDKSCQPSLYRALPRHFFIPR